MKQINEFFSSSMRVPEQIKLTNDQKSIVKGIKWQDIEILDVESDEDIFNFKFDIKGLNLSNAIVFTVRNVNDLYKIQNVWIAEDLQKLDLGYKLYRVVIEDIGHLYSPASGRHNLIQVPKIYNKLMSDSKLDVIKSNNDYLFILESNPNYTEIKHKFLN